MRRTIRILLLLFLALSLVVLPLLTGCSEEAIGEIIHLITDPGETAAQGEEPAGTKSPASSEGENTGEKGALSEDGWYYSPEDVALYLHTYGKLPSNYLTKQQAESRGWDSSAGNLWDVAEGYCIGGDRFGNYEGKLPKNNGTYYECDVNYSGGFRGAERLIFTRDGQIWYTGDHYTTFQKWY